MCDGMAKPLALRILLSHLTASERPAVRQRVDGSDILSVKAARKCMMMLSMQGLVSFREQYQ